MAGYHALTRQVLCNESTDDGSTIDVIRIYVIGAISRYLGRRIRT